MSLYVRFDSIGLPFRPGCIFKTLDEAERYAKDMGWGIYSVRNRSTPLVGDGTGFKPHFNHGLGMHIESRRQFNEQIKAKGLIEVGDQAHMSQTVPKKKNYITEKTVRTMNDMGAGVGDSEANELIA